MNKLFILILVSLFVSPLSAQQSCFEQYLREHNKKILTAEDADDSYDELKKTVLAKQMYGDSYLLMVDTVAQRAVITKVDGTYVADVHVALVDSTWYMWLSVDPLADKYPGNTPYMYCNGNPIMFIDPDGRDGYKNDLGDYVWFDDKTSNSFVENNVQWVRVTGDKDSWDEATTIRDAVIFMLSELSGSSNEEVKNDVYLFSETSCLFTKEVGLKNFEKYTKGWATQLNSYDNSNAYISPAKYGYKVKYYPAKGINASDCVETNAIGIIKSNVVKHIFEAGMEALERFLCGDMADNDPIYDMHFNNANAVLKNKRK